MASTSVLERPPVHHSGQPTRQTSAPIPAPRRLDAAAPPRRDRFIDVLRATAIVVIVTQHWLMPVLSHDAGTLSTGNALAAPGGWAITWVSQVMPLIFFAGGAAAAFSLRRRGQPTTTSRHQTSTWLAERLIRLATPVLPLATIWLVLPHILIASGVPAQPVELAAGLVGRLLWFLAAYIVLVTLTPLLSRLIDRWRGKVIVGLAAAAVTTDVIRFGWLDDAAWLGYANVVLVWGAIYAAGIAYANGIFHRLSRRVALTISAIGFAVTGLAVLAGPYAASMVGMPGEPLSNMNPPTAVLLALATGQLGLALALRDPLIRWARHRPVATVLDWISPRLLTIYLWHTPALVVVAGVTVIGFGYTTPEPFSANWRADVAMWLAASTAVLAVLVRAFGRFERCIAKPGQVGTARISLALPLAAAGLLILTMSGFNPPSDQAIVVTLAASLAVAAGVGLASPRTHRPAGWELARNAGRLAA